MTILNYNGIGNRSGAGEVVWVKLEGKLIKNCATRLVSIVLQVIIVLVLLTGTVLSVSQAGIAADEGITAPAQTELPPKGNPKLDSTLNLLTSEDVSPGPLPFTAESLPLSFDSTVRVIVEGIPGRSGEIAGAVGNLGNLEASYGDLFQVVVPVSQLTALAEMPDIRFVRIPGRPLPAVTSEGVGVINADAWQAASYNGTGIKIGILDVGFAGYIARQSQGELPASINTWWAPSIGNPGTSVHGTGCAEIVYDIAPAATYCLANFATLVEYGNAVDWLIAQGVDIISCSVGWPMGGSGNGTGIPCQIVDKAEAAGILWAQAIGNQAQMHWQGDFTDTDINNLHEFAPGDEYNAISAYSGQTIVAVLKWNDPWYYSDNDYDLLLYNNSSNLVAYSAITQDGDDEPWEALAYNATYTGEYRIAIVTLGSSQVVNLHLYSYYHDLEYQTASGSLIVPADSFNAMAVGAFDYSTPDTLEPFSSRGPTDDGRVKPDIIAPDGVSTVSYSPQTFSGTSASTPHVAGAAALVKERFPSYTPAQIKAFLEGRAVDLGSAGKDNLYGSGRLHLGNSGNYALTMAVSGSGNVTPAAGTHIYSEGATVNITAYPDTGWQFTEWTGDAADPGSDNTSVTMDADKMITANFNQTTANLTMMIDGSGNVTPAAGGHSYTLGSTVNITAAPSTNWEFVNWTGDVANPNSATTNVTMDTNKTVIANFNRINSVLKLLVIGSGSTTPATGIYTYPVNTTVNITANPSANWGFLNWAGDVADADSATTNITMDTDKIVIASFGQSTLTTAVNGSGSTTPAVGSHDYATGKTVNITATPASGWQFNSWTGDVANVNAPSTNVTMDDDKTVTANFSLISTPPSGSPGGAGGGGDTGTTSIIDVMTTEGRLVEKVIARSADRNVSLELPKGTIVRSKTGSIFAAITIKPLPAYETPPPSPPDARPVSEYYRLGPSGATFDPPVTLTFTYDPTVLSEGSDERNLFLANWDALNSQWVRVDSQVDPENDIIRTEIAHFSIYAVMEGTRPADIVVSDLSVAPEEIREGESVTISAMIANKGDLAGSYEAALRINDIVNETREVVLAGGENTTVRFDIIGDNVGVYACEIGGLKGTFEVLSEVGPGPVFEISGLTISPGEVDAGKDIDISVTVTNTGGTAGSHELILKINGTVADTRVVSLEGGVSREVVFTIIPDFPGKKIVEIGGLIGGFIVSGEVPPPEQVPLPLEKPEIPLTMPAQTAPDDSAPDSGWHWTHIVIIIAGCAVLAGLVLYLTWWRNHGKAGAPE